MPAVRTPTRRIASLQAGEAFSQIGWNDVPPLDGCDRHLPRDAFQVIRLRTPSTLLKEGCRAPL
jgi:hypothetical protein